jgi:hypothetical protein
VSKKEKDDAEKDEAKKTEPAIQTIEQLKQAYPELINSLENERNKGMMDFFASRTVEEFKANFPDLYARIAASIPKTGAPDLKVPGFLLAIDDPYAAGTLRRFAALTEQKGLQLPFVLPYKNKSTADALQNYIIRAEGGGDYSRANVAKEALKNCK